MKELKFTHENLSRHLNAYPWTQYGVSNAKYIYTTRNSIKGDVGDVFTINGVGKFVLIERKRIDEFCPWREEGFSSKEEYEKEIERIYGANSIRVLHILLKLNDEYTLKDILGMLREKCIMVEECNACPITNSCDEFLHERSIASFCRLSIEEIESEEMYETNH